MKVVVTGSSGFVGSHVVRELWDAGHQPIGYDKRAGRDLSYMMDEDPPEADAIIHLASTCSTSGSIERPLETFRDTVMTTATVCQWASRLHVPLLLTSSVKARDGMTPYGAAKRMAETWAREHGRVFHYPVVINRPGTIYGPGQEGSPESGWIAWFLKAKREGRRVTINGDGSQRRDLLYVGDYVDLLMGQLAAPVLWASGEWDVGGGESNAVTVLEMADHLGLDYVFGPERYGDAAEYIGLNAVPDSWKPVTDWRKSGMFPKS